MQTMSAEEMEYISTRLVRERRREIIVVCTPEQLSQTRTVLEQGIMQHFQHLNITVRFEAHHHSRIYRLTRWWNNWRTFRPGQAREGEPAERQDGNIGPEPAHDEQQDNGQVPEWAAEAPAHPVEDPLDDLPPN